MSGSLQILTGDCRSVLPTLEPGSVNCVVTSPPYWGLRDYGTAQWEGGDPECDHQPRAKPRATRPDGGLTGGKATVDAGTILRGNCHCGARRIDSGIGLERDPMEYISEIVGVFREVRRVLRADGTAWVNLGDGFNAYNGGAGPNTGRISLTQSRVWPHLPTGYGLQCKSLKPKDLMLLPHRTAIALQEDGWWIRGDIVWAKPNPMPESITDRPTRSHEYIFLMSKSERYWYDAEAIREPAKESSIARIMQPTFDRQTGGVKDYGPDSNRSHRKTLENFRARADKQRGHGRRHSGFNDRWDHMTREEQMALGANKRDVWTVPTQGYPGSHFATYPEKLIEPCILAGCPAGGVVLDPFAGSGTTGVVALKHHRSAILIELNPAYVELAHRRCSAVQQTLDFSATSEEQAEEESA